MAFGHVDPSKTMTYFNDASGATDIAKDTILVVGGLTAIALGNIPAGGSGELAISEQWCLPTGGATFAQGDLVYWDAGTQALVKGEQSGRLPCIVLDTRTVPEGMVGVLLNGR